jgi:hypothetical protein
VESVGPAACRRFILREDDLMRIFIIACAAAILLAGGAALVLNQIPSSAETAFSTTGARV